MSLQSELLLVGRVAAAMGLGALIGLERELTDRPAGLRTHMLVAGASALFVALGLGLTESYFDSAANQVLRADPIRVIESIVTGIAFLGAGTIIRSGPQDVTGLTTAAALLMSASVGISVALSHWILAVGIVVLTLVALQLLRQLEHRVVHKARD